MNNTVLTEDTIKNAVNSGNKDALTQLFLFAYDSLKTEGKQVKGFYYAPYVYMSNQEFDMFCHSGLTSLLDIFGFKTKMTEDIGEDGENLDTGNYTASKGDFSFKMRWESNMHDSLYSQQPHS